MSLPVPRCATCNVVFGTMEAVRGHYGSELHLHNVRLRVEGRRPLTAQEYKHVKLTEHGNVGNDGRSLFACKLCKKTFHSVQTLQAHVRSTAHLIKKEQRIIARDADAMSLLTSTSIGSHAMGLHRRHNAKRLKPPHESTKPKKAVNVCPEDREEDVSEVRCLFCGALFDSVEDNLRHMSNFHDFVLPLQHRCRDVQGLLAYLARKVNGLLCLVCGEKTRTFASLEALRAHMREKNHERIVLSPEYSEFYDVSLADAEAGEQLRSTTLALTFHDSKRTVQRREADVPRPRRKEAEERANRRKAILAADHKAMIIAQKERREVLRAHNKVAHETLRRQDGHYQQTMLKVGLRSNKLHPKGYDGEGQVN